MDPFLIKLQKITFFLATKQIISSVLIICQRSLNAHFKGLELFFKMSIRKRKSVDQVERQSTFSKEKKDEVPFFWSKQVTISQKLFIAQIFYTYPLKDIFQSFQMSTVCNLSDNYLGSNCYFFDANHEKLSILSHV